ncbi:formate dehydrogenase [Thalassobacter stenotrophicus]|uniref:formate dehydrogenase subunit gamma n=1 Tax=Thalassobacter TaxID=266808 RepID=UPI00051D9BFF|nr:MULTISPECIES: formate dehydrogenase subunit gamma [Thalassobacter]KGK80237.1 formate dehydrogenase [Thalassobacter stenotrophicus]KGL01133.1 formate dehydrogenase [Thalassobacter sp. 16PALIMAR09]
MLNRLLSIALLVMTVSVTGVWAQDTDRTSTGGAQTLQDILARQNAEKVDNSFRSEATGDPAIAAPITENLGTLGGQSDPELWRALRFGSADVTVSSGGEVAEVIMQDTGSAWLQFREGPLLSYGAYILGGTLLALLVFYLLRGPVKVDEPFTGRTVTRFKAVERFAHWLLASSFIALGITGLLVLFGRLYIAPYLGKDTNALLLGYSKLVHNSIGWAFMVALVMIFVFWVAHNLPDRTDIKWFAQFGGIVGKNHPPAKKFNGGQKIIFWSVIVFGSVISLTGVSLLFPYEVQIFAQFNPLMNQLGLAELIWGTTLPEAPLPHQEMQASQMMHTGAALVLMAIIVAHIYIGTVGMQGAYDAMGSGEVDEAWAHQHHSLWLEEVKEKEGAAPKSATLAE